MRINSLILRDGVKFGALNRVNGAYHEVENIFSSMITGLIILFFMIVDIFLCRLTTTLGKFT